jgi:hypothetical protein
VGTVLASFFDPIGLSFQVRHLTQAEQHLSTVEDGEVLVSQILGPVSSTYEDLERRIQFSDLVRLFAVYVKHAS